MEIPQECINWGRGRLSPYESTAGFAAKFCTLNGISPSQCRRLLGALLAHANWSEGKITVQELDVLARLLDEPLTVVRTLDPINLDFVRRGILSCRITGKPFTNEILGCQKCVELGYHSSFHELWWLRKCPLHNTVLQVITSAAEGMSPLFDRRVEALIQHFKATCKKWPLPPRNRRNSWWSRVPLDTLKRLRRWSIAVEGVAARMSSQQVWSSANHGLPISDPLIIFQRAKVLCPIPSEILGLFSNTDHGQLFHMTDFDADTTLQWKKRKFCLALDDLLWFYHRHCTVLGEEKPYRMALRRAINEIQDAHKSCQCRWGWSKYVGWCPVDPDGWPHWQFICAHRYAQIELEVSWGDFLSTMSSREIASELRRYYTLTRKLQSLGFVDVQQPKSSADRSSNVPITFGEIHLQLESRMIDLLNLLLTEQITGQTESVKRWLAAIDRGGFPWINARCDSSVELLESPEKLVLVKWRPA